MSLLLFSPVLWFHPAHMDDHKHPNLAGAAFVLPFEDDTLNTPLSSCLMGPFTFPYSWLTVCPRHSETAVVGHKTQVWKQTDLDRIWKILNRWPWSKVGGTVQRPWLVRWPSVNTQLCVFTFLCLSWTYIWIFDALFLTFFSSAHRIAPLVIHINIDTVDKRIVFQSNALQQGGK